MSIEIRGIVKQFGSFRALDDVSVDVDTGELVALLGPSGCGKTTLLRIVAGLETPDAGQVIFHGEETTHLPPRERGVGFVFQHYALFRHMTVFENVAFGLRVKPRGARPSPRDIRARVHQLLDLVQLDWLADRYPPQLSGGQRQRIALARALAVEPKVLLLDEPFGALDTRVRKELRRWLRRLHDEVKVTSVFVTHDQEEALEVADRVVVMNRGRVEQVGSPDEVYDRPANEFVFRFLGDVNLFHSRGDHRPGDSVPPANLVRPHDIEVKRGRYAPDGVIGHVAELRGIGAVVRLEVMPEGGGEPIAVELARRELADLALAKGDVVTVRPRRALAFAEEGGRLEWEI